MTIPYTFAGATTAIPLAQLDANFASPITLGNVAMTLSNTYTSIGNLTLTNVTVSSGNVAVTNANVTTLTATNDASISGLTVGKGGGSVADNTVVGYQGLNSNSTGLRNSAFGYQTLYTNSTGNYNTGIGWKALNLSTSDANTGVGYTALLNNSTGTTNTAVGESPLQSNTTGSYNTALGAESLKANTTASNNTAVGYQAGYSVVSGSYNTFIGNQAGYLAAPTGTALNVAVGHQAGYNLTGTANTLLGNGSGSAITSGAKNSVLGSYSGNQGGLDIRTSSNYIVLSDGDGNPSLYGTGAGFWTLGTGGTSSANTGFLQINGTTAANYGPMLRFSNNGTYLCDTGDYANVVGGSTHQYAVRVGASGGVYLAPTATSWSAVSDENRKNIIEPITNGLNKILSLRTVIGSYKEDKQNIRHPFLIAQDVQKVLPEAVSESEDREGKVLGLSYTEVIPLLVNAIQELKTEFDTYKATHP